MEIKQNYPVKGTAMTITLASLANNAGRCSTAIDNQTTLANSATIRVLIKTAGTMADPNSFSVYLVKSVDGTNFTDGFGGTDSALSPINADLLGVFTAPTTGTSYSVDCETSLYGPLPPKWAIAVVNNTGAAFDATAENFAVSYTLHDSQTS